MSRPLLVLEGVTVRFGGLTAVDALDLSVEEGSIAALIGPNGAGKTTTFNAINGVQRTDAGRVTFDGASIADEPARARARLGIARTFQNLALVPSLSVADNVAIGTGRFRRTGLTGAMLRLPRTRREDAAVDTIVDRALRFVGLSARRDVPAAGLSYGDRRRLEIARALAAAPRLLLLDEPSAGMDAAETEQLADLVRRARDAFDLTVLVIEHDMGFVRQCAERTSVLDFGRLIVEGPTATVLDDQRVIDVYLGAEETASA